MSDSESDGYSAFDFSEFTPEDFAQIDAQVQQHFTQTVVILEDDDSESERGECPDGTRGQSGDESFQFDKENVVNLSQITEEEFLEIDRLVSRALATSSSTASISIGSTEVSTPQTGQQSEETSTDGDIEVVVPAVPAVVTAGPSRARTTARSKNSHDEPSKPRTWRYRGKQRKDASLMDLFRTKRILSVTDLVGPTWCEVQYDYGLRQRRSRPIKDRPTSFKSATGKEIKVEAKVAEKNDVRTKQGQAVHKELEREVKAEELKVDVTSEEERWALRLLNAIVCFQIMQREGYTREVPVFGLVNDEIVTGIVDEVQRTPCSKRRPSVSPSMEQTRKKLRRSRSPEIDANGHAARSSSSSPDSNTTSASKGKGKARELSQCPKGRYTLRIVDTKTRTVDRLPPEEDIYSSRLQVMLYRRLLLSLMSLSSPFDFDYFWDKVGVDPTEQFSTRFLVQSGLVLSDDGFKQTTLNGLVKEWKSLIKESGIIGIETELELVYRLQPKGAKWKGKGRMQVPVPTLATSPTLISSIEEREREDRELALAIAASLADAGLPSATVEVENPKASSSVLKGEPTVIVDEGVDPELQQALYQSFKPPASDTYAYTTVLPTGSTEASAVTLVDTSIHSFKIVGTKLVNYDEELLQGHLDAVLEFWKGKRKPQGVPASLARRCE
ncbi:hypothetical protein CC1G_06585 [Coprinopsis cinerea okayama7|uniref:Uncharacterized protein n=1 Tax=Coprinopsis cinerea (strain Okayama-7 / 130 / ATCC MYA-4618 / FGSC 9003) TaxID=240176 RepID=A8N313_COPC7|nr:hypothetical protein CC1G_06585 [Coprinopsis cinerea okayama7\|eukprot:XP_001829248.2 hypothetical protein CC1G_06585 [Coprinopsis cinerea okayama7\